MNKKVTKKLHDLEEELIQIRAILDVLMKIPPENAAQESLLAGLENRFMHLEKNFYGFWKDLNSNS